MARIRPFRALRYDERRRTLAPLVAPPYDVISGEQRAEYLARSPYNVVHLTLPDSEEQAARDLAAWRTRGVLVRDEPSRRTGGSRRTTSARTASRRRRDGLVAALRAEPYESARRPPARAHARRPEGRAPPPARARRARSSSRSSSSGTGRSRSTASASRTSQVERRQALAARRRASATRSPRSSPTRSCSSPTAITATRRRSRSGESTPGCWP